MELEADTLLQKVKNSGTHNCESSIVSTNKENQSGSTNLVCDKANTIVNEVDDVKKEGSEETIHAHMSPNKNDGIEPKKQCNSVSSANCGKENIEAMSKSDETSITPPNKKCKMDPLNELNNTYADSKYFKNDFEDNQNIKDSFKSLNNKTNDDLDAFKEEILIQNSYSEMNLCNLSNPKNVSELTEICSKSSRELSCFIASQVPDICKNQPCVLGIDEAGRGPVLGPMVYGVCYCPKSKEDDLKETGCADSKTLTEEKRETIFNEICKHSEYIGWEVEVISPHVISTSMLRRSKVSLNEVSHNSAIGLLKRTLEAGVMVSEVFVDTVGPAEKYEAKLKSLFPELLITVAKKADATYPIVGAASICAKVTRDVALKSWTFSQTESSTEWGSGYPNDPVTKKFLTSTMNPIFGFPNIVRFSWSTAEKILEECAVQVDWENEEEPAKNAASVKSFFSTTEQKQHKYFKERCLKNTVTL